MSESSKKRIVKKKVAVSPAFVVGELTKVINDKQSTIEGLNGSIKRYFIVIGMMFVALIILLFMVITATDRYFVVDNFGRYVPVNGYETPLVQRERRIQHAEYIVRALNSMSFINKDKTLDDVRMYFKPEVYENYIAEKEKINFFSDMERNYMQYMSSVEPARLIGNNSRGVKKTDAECYENKMDKDGNVILNDCSQSSMEANGHAEVYEFIVKRDVYANAKLVNQKVFKVRLKLTMAGPSDGVGGYRVSEYSEML